MSAIAGVAAKHTQMRETALNLKCDLGCPIACNFDWNSLRIPEPAPQVLPMLFKLSFVRGKLASHPVQHIPDLWRNLVGGAFVSNYKVAAGFLFRKRHLCLLPPVQIGVGPTAALAQTIQSNFSPRLDKHNSVTLGIEIAFEQKRGVEDDGYDRWFVYTCFDNSRGERQSRDASKIPTVRVGAGLQRRFPPPACDSTRRQSSLQLGPTTFPVYR